MNSFPLTTPVALLVFNRPDETSRVFSAIRAARPQQLFVIADGPRSNRPGELDICREVRRICEQVDWPCQVAFNYSDTNFGCKMRVSSGLDWVFSQVEEAIILEDDCLPEETFFRFCQEMLDRFRMDHRIASIGGTNYLFDSLNIPYSYYFSLFNHIWGWATWKRAWMDYDVHMNEWSGLRNTDWLSNKFIENKAADFWKINFDKVHNNQLDTWDLQWTFACWLNNKLSIIPSANLVSNIGFSPEGTHTKDANSLLALMPVVPMEFPLSHPPSVIRDVEADAKAQKIIFSPSKWSVFFSILKSFIKGASCKSVFRSLNTSSILNKRRASKVTI
jgi:hypothetical protein